jgi:hypothetical protein
MYTNNNTRSVKELSTFKCINLLKCCDIGSRMTHFGLPRVNYYQCVSLLFPTLYSNAQRLCYMRYCTGCLIMFSVITNICNKKTKGPTAMEINRKLLRRVYTGPTGWSTRFNQWFWIQRLKDTVYTVPQKWASQSITKWWQMNSCGKVVL